MSEYLDVVDEEGNPTGAVVERAEAHSAGVLHRTSHVWVVRRRIVGGVKSCVEVLLQLRSSRKESYPSCYDVSSAGHIPAGSDFESSALRELREELGLEVEAKDLILCGVRHIHRREVFGGKPFTDNQVSRVYIVWRDIKAEDIIFQRSELDGVCWSEWSACVRMVGENTVPNCIDAEELAMIEPFVFTR